MIRRIFPLALALLASTPAFAQVTQVTQDATARRHLGFYLRMDLGLGGFNSQLNEQDLSVRGGLGSFGIAIGGALTENLILAGHAFGLATDNPEITYGGVTGTSQRTQMSLGAVGPQLTYYFMPLNLYLSGTFGLSRLYTTVDGVDSSSELGAALDLAVGKEWWVGAHWGLGLNAQLVVSGNRDNSRSDSPTWGTAGFAVAFSATYN